MMSFFKNLFGKKEESAGPEAKFTLAVEKAIRLFGKAGPEQDNRGLTQLLVSNGIPPDEAGEIMLFLPVAFVRQFLAEVNWQDDYIEYFSEGRQVEKKFSETPVYVAIEKVAKDYFKAPDSDTVLKIAGRSAEFDAINQLLHANPEAELAGLQFSPTIIRR